MLRPFVILSYSDSILGLNEVRYFWVIYGARSFVGQPFS